MKLPYSWLNELVDNLPGPEELAETLIMRGFEVEEMISPGDGIQDVVVGQILEQQQHPNADKLSYCQVTDGQETYSIVCGASNMKPGDKVALARVGTVLPGDFTIEKRKIRGEVSQGMMCSARELGLGEDHAGIIILDESAPLGGSLVDHLGLDDVVYDLGITPNRPDALSALGIAREVAAACGGTVTLPDHSPLPPDIEPDSAPSITLEAPDLCPRYTGLVVKNITIGPSPEWLQKRLEGCGVRSINNVVDITNLILMEMGQPLHAFDLDKLGEKRIVVRRAKAGEPMTTLDGVERALDEDTLVIADARQPVALAGVMGGEDSEVSEATTDILIESAYFHPPCIRRTAKKQTLSSEASYRFERGVDIEMVEAAAWRCARLIRELAGGEIAGTITVADSDDQAYFERLRGRSVTLPLDYCDRLLGKKIHVDEITRIFDSLNLKVQESNNRSVTVQVPSYRGDVQRPADLVEEVARCHGYNDFPPELPEAPVKDPEPQRVSRELVDRVHECLINAGFYETVTYSFVSEDSLEPFPPTDVPLENPVSTILNPINTSERTMRTSLAPSLLNVARHNHARGTNDLGLYEIAHVYHPEGDELVEKWVLCGIWTGAPLQNWRHKKDEIDFFDLKGLIDNLLQRAGVSKYRHLPGPPCLHPYRGVWLAMGKHHIGYFGELHPSLAEQYELSGRVGLFEIDLQPLSDALRNHQPQFTPLSPYPAVKRDLAFLLPEGVTVKEIETVINKEGGEWLESVRLFDCYRGKQVTEGYASVAFRLIFRSQDETLKEDAVDAIRHRILQRLQEKHGVQLRGA